MHSKKMVCSGVPSEGGGVAHFVRHWLATTENWIFQQLRHLPAECARRVLCHTQGNLHQFPFSSLHCREKNGWGRVFLEKHLARLGIFPLSGFLGTTLRSFRPHLVHSHFGNVGWENASMVHRLGMKHVVSFYGFDVSRLPRQSPVWRRRYQTLFREADAFLCEGPHLGKCLQELGCPPEKIHIHHLGVDLDRIPFIPRDWEFGSPIRVLIASSFREKKGIPFALEALGRFRKEYPLSITLIGDADSRSSSRREKQRILQVIEEQQLRPHVRLLGYQPHETFLQEAANHQVFMATSVTASDGDTEGGAPVSVIEMAASGMPIIASRHCDIPEVLKPYQPMLFSAEKDVEGILQSLRWVVRNGQARQELLIKTRRWIEEEYDAQKQGRELTAIYRSLE